jgi:hypothetical protein
MLIDRCIMQRRVLYLLAEPIIPKSYLEQLVLIKQYSLQKERKKDFFEFEYSISNKFCSSHRTSLMLNFGLFLAYSINCLYSIHCIEETDNGMKYI